MSHFSVAVIHYPDQNIEELLEPYYENRKVEKYLRFTRQEAIDYVRNNYADMKDKSDEVCWKYLAEDAGEDMVDDEGNIYSDDNPDAKWDWWEIGGRWNDLLKLKVGTTANSARICDIDFSPDEAKKKMCRRFWAVYVDHEPQKEGENITSFYSPDYYREYFGDAESYARRMTGFSTYAVVTPDGVWHGKGDMGWWGMSSETAGEAADWDDNYMERFIEGQDDGLIMTIVDCHI